MAIAIGGIVLVAGLYGSSALSSPSSKFFTVARAPATVPAGSTVPITFTLHNCGPGDASPCSPSSQSLGSANIALKTGFALVAPGSGYPVLSPPPGKTWTVNLNTSTNTIELRNPGSPNALAPGEEMSVTVRVTVPTFASATPYDLATIAAKQANDFSGNGNNFTYNGAPLTITVVPGPFHHYSLALTKVSASDPAIATAGVPFRLTATAFDQYDNQITTYAGPATISSTPALSSSSTGCSGTPPTSTSLPAGTVPCTPSYGSLSGWSGGTATATLKAFVKQSVTLTVTDTGSGLFTTTALQVDESSPYSLTFTKQPTETLIDGDINTGTSPAGVRVEVRDQFGNLVPGASVGMTLGDNPNLGTLRSDHTHCTSTGDCSELADGSGIATFGQLNIDTAGEYTLKAWSPASSPTANKKSTGFLVVNTLVTCSGSPCPGAPYAGVSSASATGTQNGDQIGIAAILNVLTPPTGVCGGFSAAPGSTESIVNAVSSGGSTPTLTVTDDIPKQIVNAIPNNGASQINVCLGTVNLLFPTIDPGSYEATHLATDSPPGIAWQEKDGTPADAVSDPVLAETFFWGVVPDAPSSVHTCEAAQSAGLGPVVLSKSKVGGDVLIVFCMPYPWDGNFFNG